MAETPADLFGEKVWDSLEAAGFTPAPEGSGRDGFDILRDPASDSHVIVICRREGALSGGAGNKPTRWMLIHWKRHLDDAGFDARFHGVGDTAVCLAVGVDSEAADRALAGLVEYAATVKAGVA